MTALSSRLEHLKEYHLGCSLEAGSYLYFKGDEWKQPDMKKKPDINAMPLLEDTRGYKIKRRQTKLKEPLLFGNATDTLPWTRGIKRASKEAIQAQLNSDLYDDNTNTWVIRTSLESYTKLQEQIDRYHTKMILHNFADKRVPDGPYWKASTATTRRIRQAIVLHCYHCPSLHNAVIEYVDLHSSVAQLKEYVFCKLCKKFQGLNNEQQNVIHTGVDGDDQVYNPQYKPEIFIETKHEEKEEVKDNKEYHPLQDVKHVSFMDAFYNLSIQPRRQQQQQQQPVANVVEYETNVLPLIACIFRLPMPY
jgi:hypothetical protein